MTWKIQQYVRTSLEMVSCLNYKNLYFDEISLDNIIAPTDIFTIRLNTFYTYYPERTKLDIYDEK